MASFGRGPYRFIKKWLQAVNTGGKHHERQKRRKTREQHRETCSGSGKGMNLTTIDTQTGLVVADDVGLTGNSRVGEKYFENIILWNYNDESEDI